MIIYKMLRKTILFTVCVCGRIKSDCNGRRSTDYFQIVLLLSNLKTKCSNKKIFACTASLIFIEFKLKLKQPLNPVANKHHYHSHILKEAFKLRCCSSMNASNCKKIFSVQAFVKEEVDVLIYTA